MLRLPALSHTARRPPNSGMVCASSTRRVGSAATASPSRRASANGSFTSSTEALTMALGAFTDQAGIRAEHQNHRPPRIGSRDESVDVGGFDGNHEGYSILSMISSENRQPLFGIML